MTTKTDEQQRRDFEVAYAKTYTMAALRPSKFDQEDWGDYVDVSVDIGWRMWQASRAAVEADRQSRPAASAEPRPDYSEMSREALERHAASMAQALADDKPRAFWERYAIGPKSAPSCICCGRIPDDVAVQHAEIPSIVVCRCCHDAATAPVAQELAASDVAEMATTRYRPVPDGLLRYRVVAGDGTRALFHGTKDECRIVSRRLTEAFLDGAYIAAPVAQEPAASTEPPKRPYGTETMSEYGIIPECDSAPTPPAVEQTNVDPCPQCTPGSYCATATCGRLAQMQPSAQDREDAAMLRVTVARAICIADGADPDQVIWQGNPPEPYGDVLGEYLGHADAAIAAIDAARKEQP